MCNYNVLQKACSIPTLKLIEPISFFFGFPGPVGVDFSVLFIQKWHPSRDLVLSRIYPSPRDCFIGHLQGIPFTWELSLRFHSCYALFFSKSTGAQFQTRSPVRLFPLSVPLWGMSFLCFEL